MNGLLTESHVNIFIDMNGLMTGSHVKTFLRHSKSLVLNWWVMNQKWVMTLYSVGHSVPSILFR